MIYQVLLFFFIVTLKLESERITHSYLQRPNNFPDFDRKYYHEEINKNLVSVAMGSEHYSFCTMRKNNYEEALFKIEDEKFEIDTTILNLRHAINLIEKCENDQNEEAKKNVLKRIDRMKILKKTDFVGETAETMAHIKEKLKEKVNSKLFYKNNDFDLINKLFESEIAKESSKKSWKEVSDKNFHKSLDHQLFYFKRQEKVLYTQSS